MSFFKNTWNRFWVNQSPVVASTCTLIGCTVSLIYMTMVEPLVTPDDTAIKVFVGLMFSFGLVFSAIMAFLGVAMLAALAYEKLKLKKPIALPLRAFSTNTVLYTWEDWRRDNKEEFPVRYFITETVRLFLVRKLSQAKNAIRWVKYRTIKRNHVLNISGPGYNGGYIDQSDVILYASFAALVKFVEEVQGGVFMDAMPLTYAPDDKAYWERHVEIQHEIKGLYNWWKMGRLDDFEEDQKEDQLMLHRLIELRPYLWD